MLGSSAPVKERRRVDWSVILGSDKPTPAAIRPSPRAEFGSVLSAFSELLTEDDVDIVLRRAVEIAREKMGLRRVAIFLLDRERDLMLGTWGTDLKGLTADEHHVMYELGPSDREVFQRAERDGIPFTVIDNCPIVEQKATETRVVGQGWVACTPIRGARGAIGTMFNDTGLTGEPVDMARQARVAVLCSFLGVLVDRAPLRRASGLVGPLSSGTHPVVLGTLRLLARDPSLGGKEIASDLGLSLSRLARVFKAEMGMSLVEYRNRLRLERFDVLLDAGGDNLLEAALASGFGSYSQFHRVFRALRGMTPKEYLRESRQLRGGMPKSTPSEVPKGEPFDAP